LIAALDVSNGAIAMWPASLFALIAIFE